MYFQKGDCIRKVLLWYVFPCLLQNTEELIFCAIIKIISYYIMYFLGLGGGGENTHLALFFVRISGDCSYCVLMVENVYPLHRIFLFMGELFSNYWSINVIITLN